MDFSDEVVTLTKTDLFKKLFVTNCDKMLNVVNFRNGGTGVHRRILNVMLRVLLNFLLIKLIDISVYLGKYKELRNWF